MDHLFVVQCISFVHMETDKWRGKRKKSKMEKKEVKLRSTIQRPRVHLDALKTRPSRPRMRPLAYTKLLSTLSTLSTPSTFSDFNVGLPR